MLKHAERSPGKEIVRRARVRGLITGGRYNWSIQGDLLARKLVKVAGKPWSAEELYGFGELRAWASHEQVLRAPKLEKRNTNVQEIVERGVEIAYRQLGPVPHALAIERDRPFLEVTKISQEVMGTARGWLVSGWHRNHRLYGLGAVIEAALAAAPQSLARLLMRGGRKEFKESIVALVAGRLQDRGDEMEFIAQLLRTRVPCLQALAIVAMLEHRVTGSVSVDEVLKLASRSGLSEPTGWLLSLRVVDDLVADARRRRWQSRSQASAPPSDAHAAAEQALDAGLHQLCQAFPHGSEVERACSELAWVFGPDLARLAMTCATYLGKSQATTLLSDAVIAQLKDSLGLNEGRDAPGTSSLTYEDFEQRCQWWMKAVEIRYSQDSAGVGRRAGQLLEPLSRLAQSVLDPVGASVRWPSTYANVLKRRAGSVTFALEVACGAGSPAEAAARTPLLRIAYAEAEKVLKADRIDVETDGFTDNLALVVVGCMARGSRNEDRRSIWSADPGFPAYVRALCLWTDPTQLLSNPPSALAVASAITEVITSSRQHRRVWQQAAALADVGTALAYQAGDLTQFASVLSGFWAQIKADLELPKGEWQRLDQILVGALGGPGRDRDALRSMVEWTNSRCVALLPAPQA